MAMAVFIVAEYWNWTRIQIIISSNEIIILRGKDNYHD